MGLDPGRGGFSQNFDARCSRDDHVKTPEKRREPGPCVGGTGVCVYESGRAVYMD